MTEWSVELILFGPGLTFLHTIASNTFKVVRRSGLFAYRIQQLWLQRIRMKEVWRRYIPDALQTVLVRLLQTQELVSLTLP